MKVLVTDAGASAAVATVRSLGRRGVTVVAAWHGTTFPLAATSRHCSGVARLPDPLDEPDRFAGELLRMVRRDGFDAVVPVSDATLAACSSVRDRLEARAVYCAAPEEALRAAEDKWGILERAEALGLGVPPSRLVRDRDDLQAALGSLPLPWVLRSRSSLLREGRRIKKPATRVVFDPAPAARDIEARLANAEPVVVTSYRRGTGRGVYLFMAGERAAVWFGHLRLRETNPCGSPACAAVPLQPEPETVRRCGALLAGLGVTGAAMIEFRRGEGGQDVLVEINPRLWGSIPLAVHAGLDFPWWQYRYFTSGEIPSMTPPRADLEGCRYLMAEVGRLANVLRGAPEGWREPFPTFPEAWSGFVSSFGGGWTYYNQSGADPLPGLAEPIMFLWERVGKGRR